MEMIGFASARAAGSPRAAVSGHTAISATRSAVSARAAFRSLSFFGCKRPPLRLFASGVHLSLVKPMASLSCSHHQEALSHGVKFAYISVYDKKDLILIGKGLLELGYTLLSTSATKSALENAGLAVTDVDSLGGRLFDVVEVVVVNLRPFYEVAPEPDRKHNIWLPVLIVYAVLNFKHVLVVVDPEDYPAVLGFLKSHGDDINFHADLALKANHHVGDNCLAAAERIRQKMSSLQHVEEMSGEQEAENEN